MPLRFVYKWDDVLWRGENDTETLVSMNKRLTNGSKVSKTVEWQLEGNGPNLRKLQ